jgi:DoxX-like family
MQPGATSAAPSKKALWAGWILGVLPALMLTMSGLMKLVQPTAVVEGFEHLGWPVSLAVGLGVVEIGCTIVYLIPSTTILGAILLTGYLGGAMATHLRIGESLVPPLLVGVVVWLGIFLREPRLRALIPLRKTAS